MLKNLSILCLFILVIIVGCKKDSGFSSGSVSLSQESEEIKQWKDNKLTMMIHFGLYSVYGGVYNGQNILKGYSEQIMAHAPIPNEEYKAMASSFNPTTWNPDSIASLAVQGGFKSIILTAKHHDGFCLFDSEVSDFTVIKSTPFKRDLIRELSESCSKAGIGMGVYFSLIDWNAKAGATQVSSHNADLISPELHQANLDQVKELLSNYGNLTEIWFDMGALTVQQSRELRAAVKDLQPNCLINGRLGHGQGDYIVWGDNENTSLKMEQPWQTVNSINPDSWGYRSWSSTGDPGLKAQELLKQVLQTVYNGGNYMLNLGLKGDGSILEFEKQVIKSMGTWLNSENGEAIYGSRPFPGTDKSWGGITINPPNIYFIITSPPDEGKLLVYGLNNSLGAASEVIPPYNIMGTTKSGPTTTFDLGMIELHYNPATVFRVQYDGPLDLTPAKQAYLTTANRYELNYHNASLGWGAEGSNYYTTVPVVTSMTWDLATPKEVDYEMVLFYTQQEKNKKIRINLNGHEEVLDLSKYKTFRQTQADITKAIPSNIYYQGPYGGNNMTTHLGPLNWASPGSAWSYKNPKPWTEMPNVEQGQFTTLQVPAMSSVYYLINVLGQARIDHITAFGTDDAVMAWFNGKLIYSAGKPQEQDKVIFLDLPVEQESNTLILKHFNTDSTYKTFFNTVIDQVRFEKRADYCTLKPKETNKIILTLADPIHPNENLGIPNIKIFIQEKKK